MQVKFEHLLASSTGIEIFGQEEVTYYPPLLN